MEAEIIQVKTSLALIVPDAIIKKLELKAGARIDLQIQNREVVLCRSKKVVREGWAEKFALYAAEGEDKLMLPDVVDTEAVALM